MIHGISFHRPVAFWTGATFVTVGVLAHLPDYLAAGDMHFHMAGMPMSRVMIAGMLLVAGGMALATWGLLPPTAAATHRATTYHLRAIDDAALTGAHWGLLFVLGVALVIDVMKPATLGFVIPGMSSEYGIPSARTAWLLICALAGTTIGSVVWGVMADRLGRRAAILLASLMFIGTSICGAMPSFAANLVMCFLMGLAAGGMLPIVYALMAESVPAKSRGWLVVLHGGMGTVGGTLAAAGFAALLEPTWSWRALWLMNLPTFLRGAGFTAGTSSYLLFLSAIVAIPGTVLVAYAYGMWSSRRSMVAFAVASIACALGLAWLAPSAASNRAAVVGMLALLYAATGGVIAMLSPYTAEVFPTRLRGTGSGVSAGSSKLGGLLGAIGTVTGVISVSTGMLRPALLVSIPLAIAAILVATRGLETRGRPLEELVDGSRNTGAGPVSNAT